MAGRERDLERLLTFVDAVVAIAITLLVLPLVELGDQVRVGGAAALLREHADDVLGFVLSFVVIAQLWLAQKAVVGSLVRESGTVVWLLVAWTFTIVVLPFPTALVTGTDDDPVAKVFYIGTMAMSSALLAALAWVIGRDRSLRDTEAGPDPVTSAAITLAFLLALAISLAIPATGYYPLLLLFVTGPAVDLLRRRGVLRSP